ncbi:MAG: hypothetical protein JXB60_07030 [Candidatus Cloacimonetes bacterium]|nr:hypothetical protein [Candidatus Cloacimonadota bacterium]
MAFELLRSHHYKFFLLLLISIVFTACSMRYVPLPSPGVEIVEEVAVISAEDVLLTVENRYWTKEPDNLSDYFSTFFISAKNLTKSSINITPEDINLLDQFGNQFDIVSTDYVEKMLLPDDFDLRIVELVGEKEPALVDEWREAKQNLITYSFHFGTILPGAKKSGFIFYPRLASKNIKCSVIFRNQRINFIRNDKKNEA